MQTVISYLAILSDGGRSVKGGQVARRFFIGSILTFHKIQPTYHILLVIRFTFHTPLIATSTTLTVHTTANGKQYSYMYVVQE